MQKDKNNSKSIKNKIKKPKKVKKTGKGNTYNYILTLLVGTLLGFILFTISQLIGQYVIFVVITLIIIILSVWFLYIKLSNIIKKELNENIPKFENVTLNIFKLIKQYKQEEK